MKRVPPVVSFLLAAAVLGMGSGLLYDTLTTGRSPLRGVVYGAAIGLSISVFERGLVLRRTQERVRQWSALPFVLAMGGLSLLMVVVGIAVGGSICWGLGLVHEGLLVAVVPSPQGLIYSLVVAAILVFVARMRDLLGHDVFNNLLLGRYHKPVEERRIFLFLDLVGSMAFARRHGDLRAQEYLSAIFAAIAEPVHRHRGTIDDYIGDMAMITWPEALGLADARCVRCIFEISAEFRRDAASWEQRLGQVPEFYAAMHGGPVVTAEIGIDRHKISYFGDAVNLTARIEGLCHQLSARVLVSADLLRKLPILPPNVWPLARGDHPMKGLDQRLEVFSLELGPDT